MDALEDFDMWPRKAGNQTPGLPFSNGIPASQIHMLKDP